MILLRKITCNINSDRVFLRSSIGFHIFLPFFLSISLTIIAQNQCFTVLDSATLQAVPFCNIQLNNQGIVTNHLGQFCLPNLNDASDSLLVSNISYKPMVVQLNKFGFDSIIYLSPKSYEIHEISIDGNDYKYFLKGNKLKRPEKYKMLWHACQTGLFIPLNGSKEYVVESVSVLVKNTSKKRLPFRLHIFNIDSLGGVGDDLLPTNVYGKLVDGNIEKVKMDVLPYQVKVSEPGFYVAIELLSDKKATFSFNNNTTDKFVVRNQIGMTKARFRQRKLLKVSLWKPGKFYIEPFPYTNVAELKGNLPMIEVRLYGKK